LVVRAHGAGGAAGDVVCDTEHSFAESAAKRSAPATLNEAAPRRQTKRPRDAKRSGPATPNEAAPRRQTKRPRDAQRSGPATPNEAALNGLRSGRRPRSSPAAKEATHARSAEMPAGRFQPIENEKKPRLRGVSVACLCVEECLFIVVSGARCPTSSPATFRTRAFFVSASSYRRFLPGGRCRPLLVQIEATLMPGTSRTPAM
jgi:hypothetical protein